MEDYNKGTAPLKNLERNLLLNPFGNRRVCSLSDPNSACSYSFDNPTTSDRKNGTCRGYVTSLVFINNNFTFRKSANYKGQCPLPKEVCTEVFGSYEKLVFPPKGQLDKYFSWNADSCTYEIPCFANLAELSKNCYQPDRSQSHPSYPEDLFQHLVQSFHNDELETSKIQEKAKQLGYEFPLRLEKIPSDISKAFVAREWASYRREVLARGFPAMATMSLQSDWYASHAILWTGYDQAKDELLAIDPNYPGQIVRVKAQGAQAKKMQMQVLNAQGQPTTLDVQLYGIMDEADNVRESFYYHSRYYALTQQKKCNGKIRF
jgi:hypothetical protein